MGISFSARKTDQERGPDVRGGLDFCGVLTILFIGLKLTGYISWPWLLVLSPLWVPLALVITLVAIIGTFMLIAKWLTR